MAQAERQQAELPRLLVRRREQGEETEAARAYLLLEQIGSGGQAEVYRAQEQFGMQRDVAVKLLRIPEVSDATAEAMMIRRFIRESDIALSMRHPHIVRVYDVGIDEAGSWFYVMELVAGKSLAGHIDTLFEAYGRGERADAQTNLIQASLIPQTRILRLWLQVLDAVEALHTKSILHRDLKPENVLLKNPDYALLADCGIAKPTGEEAVAAFGGTLTVDHRSFLGTPHYMAPEQLGWKYQVLPGGAQKPWGVCAQSDIWALGIILYEMVTGRLPFMMAENEGLEALKGRIESENVHVPPFATYVANADPRLEAFVMLLLQKQPWKRPASIAEVKRLFKEMVLDQPPLARFSAKTVDAPLSRAAQPPVEEPEPPRSGKRRSRHVVVPVLLFCLFAVGVYFLWKRSGLTFSPSASPSSGSVVSASETGSALVAPPLPTASATGKQKSGAGPKPNSDEGKQYQRGLARFKVGDCVSAERHMLATLIKYPDFPSPLLVLAECARRRGKTREACEQYRAYLGYEGMPPLSPSAQTFYAACK